MNKKTTSEIWDELHTKHGLAAIVGEGRYTDEEYNQYGMLTANYINDLCQLKNKNVLDYGCGNGRVSRHVVNMCKELYCVDASSIILEECKKYTKNAIFLNIDHPKDIKKQSYFDLIYSIAVIYHMTDIETYNFLYECKNLLKPNGKILFDYCNIFHNIYVNTLLDKINKGDWKDPWPWTMQNIETIKYISTQILKFKEFNIINNSSAQPIIIVGN